MSDTNGTTHIINERFEIRQLGPEHTDWVMAIQAHSNIFHSPVWSRIYTENSVRTELVYRALHQADRPGTLQRLESGLCYGVFDREYQYKRASSAATNGALYWDENNLTATGEELLAQMDFPLVSIAIASDAGVVLDKANFADLVGVLPFFGPLCKRSDELDTRDKATWEATGPKQVMMRNGTSTRPDYEGLGLMKKLAHFLMRRAAELGFRAICIDCLSDAVQHVWMNPPEPFRATLVFEVNVNQIEGPDADGKEVVLYPFLDQISSRVYVDLK